MDLVTHRATLFVHRGVFVQNFWNFPCKLKILFHTKWHVNEVRLNIRKVRKSKNVSLGMGPFATIQISLDLNIFLRSDVDLKFFLSLDLDVIFAESRSRSRSKFFLNQDLNLDLNFFLSLDLDLGLNFS